MPPRILVDQGPDYPLMGHALAPCFVAEDVHARPAQRRRYLSGILAPDEPVPSASAPSPLPRNGVP